MAYKYFFKTLNAQSQRLLQNVEVREKTGLAVGLTLAVCPYE